MSSPPTQQQTRDLEGRATGQGAIPRGQGAIQASFLKEVVPRGWLKEARKTFTSQSILTAKKGLGVNLICLHFAGESQPRRG